MRLAWISVLLWRGVAESCASAFAEELVDFGDVPTTVLGCTASGY